MAKLTPKQQRFIEEYLVDLNATQAAIRAGYFIFGVKKMTKKMTMKEQGWYHTSAHRRWRKLVLQRDKICQHCKRRAATEAHHIKPLEDYPELALDLDNGQGLCWDCHELTKKRGKQLPAGVRVIKV